MTPITVVQHAGHNQETSVIPHPRINESTISSLIDGLATRGYAVIEDAFPNPLCQTLATELIHRREQDQLMTAGIGRGQQHVQRQDIRSDEIHWLDRSTPAQIAYFYTMEHLREEINRALFLGLFELEAHFALYPPGSFYKCHFDSFQGRSNRVISSVLYLNKEWPADAGGEMALYDQSDMLPAAGEHPLILVKPRMGTLACFLSERTPHAVLPTQRSRMSIAGWFRRNASLGGIIDPAR